jgi:hypothetical protein
VFGGMATISAGDYIQMTGTWVKTALTASSSIFPS